MFTLENYHLVQSGPAFAADLDATVSRSGEYVVITTDRKNKHEQKFTGKLDIPIDVYNGMIIVVGKNLVGRAGQTVHVVAFTPKPMVLPLEITPSGTQPLQVGEGRHAETAMRFTLKPKLNLLLKIGAALKVLAAQADEVVIATDFDREGELIGVEALGLIREARPEIRAVFSASAGS